MPLVAVIEAADPAVFVSRKLAGVANPLTLAETVYCAPAVVFAVNVADVATPAAFVVAVFTPPANVPLGPVEGAVKVTVSPPRAVPLASLTVTTSGAKAVPLVTLWGVPLVAVMDPGVPAVLVKTKVAGPDTPVTVAITL